MDVIAAYREVGTYRGAAALCGVTPRRSSGSSRPPRAGEVPAARADRARNYDVGGRCGGRSGGSARPGGSRPSGCCPRPGRPVTPVRPGTSGVWWPRPSRIGVAVITGAVDRRCGRRARRWLSTGASEGPLHVFCAVLAWSRWRFVRFAADERAETTLAMLAECFERARRRAQGGAGRPDGLSQGRGGRQRGRSPLRTMCVSPLTTGSGRISARAATRASKGIVENLVGYAKSDLIVPAEPDVERGWARRTRRPEGGATRSTRRSTRRSAPCPAERLVTEAELLGLAAVAATSYRSGHHAQSRPAVLCADRLGPLLGPGRPDRPDRGGVRP